VVARAAATAGAAAVAGVDAKKINAKPVAVITGGPPWFPCDCATHLAGVSGSPGLRCQLESGGAEVRGPARAAAPQAPRPAWAWPPPLRWPRAATGTW
jgi:hypothetical protein